MESSNIQFCIGTVLAGINKGKQCTAPAVDNGYCLKHNKYCAVIDKNKTNGIKTCANINNRCVNIIDIDSKEKYCNSCKEKKKIKKFNCKHNGCKFNVKIENTYCKIHVLDEFRDYKKINNVKFCKINRNCRNIITDKSNICPTCKDIKAEIIANIREEKKINCDYKPISEALNKFQNKFVFDIEENWRQLQRGAFMRNLLFNLSYEEYIDIVIKPCEYCGFISKFKVNGCDRIDNDKGYFKNNIYPACSLCNKIKGNQKLHEFIFKIKSIVNFTMNKIPINNDLINKFKSTFTSNDKCGYIEYKNQCIERRNIDFLLTKEEYFELINKDCYLCGIKTNDININGIDRLHSLDGYTISNSKPCCAHCNFCKNNLDINIFIDKCREISKYCQFKFIYDENLLLKNTRNQKRNEVYSVQEITDFVKNNKYNKFINWCIKNNVSNEYIIDLKNICDTYQKSNDDTVLNLITDLKFSVNEKSKVSITGIDLFNYLLDEEKNEFIEFFEKTYEKSSLFDEKFSKLCDKFNFYTEEKQIYKCNKFIYKEKKRQLNKNFIFDKSEIDNLNKFKKEKINAKIGKFNRIIADMNKINNLNDKFEIYSKEIIPKIWKAKNIYDFIIKDKESYFLDELISTNKHSNIFPNDLNKIILQVKENKDNKDKCLLLIKNLLDNYRKERTLLLLSKK
jgi:hypothetical protein